MAVFVSFMALMICLELHAYRLLPTSSGTIAAGVSRNISATALNSIATTKAAHESGVVTLTILSLVGLYMTIGAKSMDGVVEMNITKQHGIAGKFWRRIMWLSKDLGRFHQNLISDLEQLPEDWAKLNHNAGDEISALAVEGLENQSLQGVTLDSQELFTIAQNRATSLALQVIGQADDFTNAVTGVFGFALSVVTLANSIRIHALTSTDTDATGQIEQFQMFLLAQEAAVYESFCKFVKTMWEYVIDADAAVARSNNKFEIERNEHIAGEMQRAWRCHCLPQTSGTGVHRDHRADIVRGEGIELHLDYDSRCRTNGFKMNQLYNPKTNYTNFDMFSSTPEDYELIQGNGCLNGHLRLTTCPVGSCERREWKTNNVTDHRQVYGDVDPFEPLKHNEFVSDIQVVRRHGTSVVCGGTQDLKYETQLMDMGYKLLYAYFEYINDWSYRMEINRYGKCLADATLLGNRRTGARLADIQMGVGVLQTNCGVVLVYYKVGKRESDIPITDVKVVYGTREVATASSDGWTVVPVPLYHDASYQDRLNLESSVPFLAFKRDHATVSCPEGVSTECCNKQPSKFDPSNPDRGRTWCDYKPFLSKNPIKIQGYEDYIKKRFPSLGEETIDLDADWCERNVQEYGALNEGVWRNFEEYGEAFFDLAIKDLTDRGMWLRGCTLARYRVHDMCEEGIGRKLIRRNNLGMFRGDCTGRAFLEKGDPLAGRYGGAEGFAWVLADLKNVYGFAGVAPNCNS